MDLPPGRGGPRDDCMNRISGVAEIAAGYGAFLVDAWGVLHDGGDAFEPARACLEHLAAAGKPVVVVSNASRREAAMAAELDRSGIDARLYRACVTSGELTWQALARGAAANGLGESAYYLGPERSRAFCDGLPYRWSDAAAADFVVNTGVPEGEPATAEPLRPLLEPLAARCLPMVCVNPDKVAIRRGHASISAGAIALLYRQISGADVIQFGKPETGIFAAAQARLDPADRGRVLMIGDDFETDIAGAARAGLDSLLITGGIHHDTLTPADDSAVGALAARFGAAPTYYCDALRW